MTPFSPAAVTVYSNCDEVRLTRGADGRQYTWCQPHDSVGMPSPVITFPDVFDVYTDKQLSRSRRQADSYLLAEGLIDGKVVATHKVMPARRPNRIKLWVDNEGVPLRADGSDMVVVVAAITDERGTIKRLNFSWGVVPVAVDDPQATTSHLERAEHFIANCDAIAPGESAVITAGQQTGSSKATPRGTNLVKIYWK